MLLPRIFIYYSFISTLQMSYHKRVLISINKKKQTLGKNWTLNHKRFAVFPSL